MGVGTCRPKYNYTMNSEKISVKLNVNQQWNYMSDGIKDEDYVEISSGSVKLYMTMREFRARWRTR